MYDYLIVGAGLFGQVFARQATDAGKKVLVIDKLYIPFPMSPEYTNSKKEQRKILKLMHEVKNDESMILDRKSTRLNSSHKVQSRMPSSA